MLSVYAGVMSGRDSDNFPGIPLRPLTVVSLRASAALPASASLRTPATPSAPASGPVPAPASGPAPAPLRAAAPLRTPARPAAPASGPTPAPAPREPLWRDVVGDALRRERIAQSRTLRDVAETARISMPYLSEIERGRKEASSEVLAAAARALGLGLADLLAMAQGELLRLSATTSTSLPLSSLQGLGQNTPRASFGQRELCLAA